MIEVPSMKYHELGDTGIQISEIGFGTWAIGGRTPGLSSYGETDDKTSRQAIDTALELGINFFDTANIYGNGHSEELLGAALTASRSRVVIATKAGFLNLEGDKDFSPAAILKSVEGSLARLGTSYVDLLQLHDPPTDLANNPHLIDTLEALRGSGKVREFGVSVKSPSDGLAFLSHPWKTIQCNLNMIDLRALDCGLLSRARQKGIAILARTPMAFGFLSGAFLDQTPEFKEGDHRARWSPQQIAIWAQAPRLFSDINKNTSRTLSQLAIKFCSSMDGVATTISGITTSAEAVENAATSSLPRLTEDEMQWIIRTSRAHNFFLK